MFRWLVRTSIFALATLTPAMGQVLQVSLFANGAITPVAAGGSAVLTGAGVGQPATSTLTVRYAGTTSATITAASLSGASAITLLASPSLPLVLLPNASTTFTVQYLPATGSIVSSVMSISFTENGQGAAIAFNLVASAPDVAFSYSISPNGATTGLSSGDRITFPATNPGSSVSAVISVSNRGSAAGPIQSITASGGDFQIADSPAPTTVAAGQTSSFRVIFTPHANGASSGVLSVGLGSYSISFGLSGVGAAPDFLVSYTFADNNVHTLSDGTAIPFPSVDINSTSTAVVAVVNQGSGTGSITGISLSGAGFQLNGTPQIPASIASGQVVRFSIVFSPKTTGAFTGSFRIDLTGRSISGTLSGSSAASNFSVSYIDPDTNNIVALSNNSTIPFPNTVSGANSVITLLVGNTGAGTGNINSIALDSAAGFQLVNLPSLPLAVPPSQQARFGIRFNPQQQQLFTNVLRLDLGGQITALNLQAQGTQAQYSYSYSSSTGTSPVSPGGTITLPDTTAGQTTSTVISFSNLGLGDGLISAISVTGQGLSLSDLPALPLTLHANGSQHFTLNFTPASPDGVNGRLTIGSDTFTVTGTGVGSRLSYTYTSASSVVPVLENGVIIFSPLPVGNMGSLDLSIQNTGTSVATISSINLTAASGVFSLSKLPSLPFDLNPGASSAFTISFVPNNTGSLTATLRINNSAFTLSGSGTQPAPVPSYQFQGPSGDVQPAQQPSVGLSLASPYPLALQGTLKLTFVSSVFTDDPSIQFASGSRTVNFTIPANSTQALFTNGSTTVALQSGTTAGAIAIVPSFAMQSGFDLTPASPQALNLNIPRVAPQLVNASVSAVTLTGFTLVLNGYTTTRGIRQFDVQLTPRQGQNFSASHLPIDVTSASSAWFQGAASQGFGGSFLVAIPFALSNGASSDDLVHLLQSLSITATNEVGSSVALTVTIP